MILVNGNKFFVKNAFLVIRLSNKLLRQEFNLCNKGLNFKKYFAVYATIFLPYI